MFNIGDRVELNINRCKVEATVFKLGDPDLITVRFDNDRIGWRCKEYDNSIGDGKIYSYWNTYPFLLKKISPKKIKQYGIVNWCKEYYEK